LTRRDFVVSVGLKISEVLEKGLHLEDTWKGRGGREKVLIRNDEDDDDARRGKPARRNTHP